MSTGGTPASEMLGLLFMLLHSLDGILPNHVPLPNNSKLSLRKKWNVKGVVINALQATYEVAILLKQKNLGFTYLDFDALDNLICSTRCHELLLYEMRNDLSSYALKIDGNDIVCSIFGGHKSHLLSHLVKFMWQLGTEMRITDTGMSEHFHMFIKG